MEENGTRWVRVVDYKTGAKRFDLAELRYGLGLQMLLYLFTLRDEGGKLFGGYPIEPAGVLYLPAREKLLNLPRNASEEEIERAMHKELQRSGMAEAQLKGQRLEIGVGKLLHRRIHDAVDRLTQPAEKIAEARIFLVKVGEIFFDVCTDRKQQLINKLEKHMNSPISQRGKGSMTHGKGKRKRK